jgi:FkbM family methyltransferase
MESPSAPPYEAPFGARAPNLFDRAVMALTVRLPESWAGLKLAMALRRLVTMRMDTADALDVTRWRLRMRLHPRDNGCEKNLLFTPQMYEPPEREELAREIARAGARPFVFVDVGANVGLFSLYVAAIAPVARILAIEPEPGNFARLAFNIAANPGVPITPFALALGDAEGAAEIVLNARDRGGTRLAAGGTQGRGVAVRSRPLLAVITEAGVTDIDALKIDVEGAEDLVLVPFFRDAPPSLWPRLVVIEDSSAEWSTDLFTLLKAKGYEVSSRSKQNVMLRRSGGG